MKLDLLSKIQTVNSTKVECEPHSYLIKIVACFSKIVGSETKTTGKFERTLIIELRFCMLLLTFVLCAFRTKIKIL